MPAKFVNLGSLTAFANIWARRGGEKEEAPLSKGSDYTKFILDSFQRAIFFFFFLIDKFVLKQIFNNVSASLKHAKVYSFCVIFNFRV